MFDERLAKEFLKISEAEEIFSSENHSRQFGTTFAAKGGGKKLIYNP